MNQIQYQQTQANNLIQNQNQNQTSLYPIHPMANNGNDLLKYNNQNILNFKTLFEELSLSTHAQINESSKFVQNCLGCQDNKTFKVFLTVNGVQRFSFICKENSEKCQRFCIKQAFKNCVIDIFYNYPNSPPNLDFLVPYIVATRTNGGYMCWFCNEKHGILNVFLFENNKKIGSIVQNEIYSNYIKDSFDNSKYSICPVMPEIKKEKCCCCTVTNSDEHDNFKPIKYKILQGEEQVGDIAYKDITFPSNATPEDKLLLILGLIFISYTSDFSDNLCDMCFNILHYCFPKEEIIE